MSNNEQIVEELKQIKQLLYIISAEKIKNEIEKFATTNDRKIIWVLIDGKRINEEIAKNANVSLRSVQRVLKIAEDLKFIKNPWGKPAQRIIDYVPPNWFELLPQEKVSEKDEKGVEKVE